MYIYITAQQHPNNRKLRGTTNTFKCAPLFHGFLAPPSDPLPTPPLLCGLRCPRKTESKPSPTGALVLFPTPANERRKKQDKDNTTGGAVLRNQVSEIHSKASWMGWGPHSSPRVHSVRLKRTASRKPPGLVFGPQPTKMLKQEPCKYHHPNFYLIKAGSTYPARGNSLSDVLQGFILSKRLSSPLAPGFARAHGRGGHLVDLCHQAGVVVCVFQRNVLRHGGAHPIHVGVTAQIYANTKWVANCQRPHRGNHSNP